ncbi:MAG: hypothetical protein JRI95_17105 [Deltaproteobacteria bacterium]|nr:hypothetical protein [Deltaproteobacteria bacterium]
MSLELLPGIVWALDEKALDFIRRWHGGLSSKAQMVFQIAGSWKELAYIIDDYREQRFDTTIIEAGLSLRPQLERRRVNVVVVASFPQKEGQSWSEVEEKLQAVGQQVTLQQHRVLLHHAYPKIKDKPFPAKIDPIEISMPRILPWLLTREISSGRILGEEDFYNLFASLIDCLLLAEREGGQVPGHLLGPFLNPPAESGKVRLVGFARIPLDRVLDRMSEALTRVVLGWAYHRPYEPQKLQTFEQRLALLVQEFLTGCRTYAQVEEFILGNRGLKSLSVAIILKEVKQILEIQTQYVIREGRKPQPTPGFLIRFWRRYLGWWTRKAAGISDFAPIIFDNLIQNLHKMSEVIDNIAKQARQETDTHPNIPPDLIQIWSAELHDLVIEALNRRWSGVDVTDRLARIIRQGVSQHFSDALYNWGLEDDLLEEAARALQEGNLLRFSGRMEGGLRVQVQTLVTSLKIGETLLVGAQPVACATLQVWPGRPPLFLAATEAVPIDHLKL